ncbi:MAG: hypothetical protein ACOX9R_18980 [Armatimonadota bacterium]|jgi:hypothetical protein
MNSMLEMDWQLMLVLVIWMLAVLMPLMVARIAVAPDVGAFAWIAVCLAAYFSLTLSRSLMLGLRQRDESILLGSNWTNLEWELAVAFVVATLISASPPTLGPVTLLYIAGIIVVVSALMGLLVIRRESG